MAIYLNHENTKSTLISAKSAKTITLKCGIILLEIQTYVMILCSGMRWFPGVINETIVVHMHTNAQAWEVKMTEKDCRRLSRNDLIEIISQLQKEKTSLNNRIETMKKELGDSQEYRDTQV